MHHRMTEQTEKIAITVVLPVKNEAKNLPRCLEKLHRFAKVYVVDSGSEDATQEIATKAGAEVVQFLWDGKFPKKRNWFLQNYTIPTEWVLFLDADEIINDEFCNAVDEAISSGTHVGYWLTFHNWFQGKYLRHGDPFSKLAFFKPSAGCYERIDEDMWSHLDMEIHEHPILDGTLGTIHAPIDHDDRRGLQSYIEKHNEYASWEAKRYIALGPKGSDAWNQLTDRQRKKYSVIETWWFPVAYFFVSFVLKAGFLDGRAGFVFARMKAQYFKSIRIKINEARSTST